MDDTIATPETDKAADTAAAGVESPAKERFARAVEEAADWRVSIPYGREVGYALGAAAAAAILSFEILRQRRMKS